ncbi:MAG: hypothetical protein GXP62_06165, partial [Oligoflexia bacterium]|nr:hypothetical protein [Oligoflexia bacterium]
QGPGATYAYIRAARAWDIAEDKQQELATWEKAYARHSAAELGWAAASGLAAARFDSGDVDAAVTVLVEWAGQRGSYDAQRSLFDAARYQELAGQTEQALVSYQALVDRFPQSMLADQTAAAIGRLQSNG